MCISWIPCTALAQNFTFSMEAHTGLVFGRAREYVYEGGKRISKLEWDENAVPYVHTAFNFAYKHFFISGAVKAAVPVRAGYMRDYDYLLPNSNALTNFSEHTAMLERHNVYDINTGYEFIIGRLLLSPALGFAYASRKWAAQDGYYQYASGGAALHGDEPIRRVTGPVISYEQKISYLYIDLRAGYILFNRLLIGAQFQFFPYVWAESMDHHILRETEFYDVMPGGMGILAGLTVEYKPAPSGNIAFITGFTFKKIFEKSGTIAQRATGLVNDPAYTQSTGNSSGADGGLWRVFLGVKLERAF